MKTHLTALLALAVPVVLSAQEVPPDVPTLPTAPVAPAVTESADPSAQNLLTAEQLDQLLGPIALYPDALIAIILPAATVPGDVAIAARYIRNDGNAEAASGRAWDDSIKSLVHYPEVLKWMDDNLEWTQQLGEAFREQPADVMNAVQRLRAKARAAGTLVDTPQQQVAVDQDVISIVPAQPDVIYVPYYDPGVVYASPSTYYYSGYSPSSFVTFSAGFAVGSWLAYDCDWRHRTLWTIDRRHWATARPPGYDWRRPVFPGRPSYVADPYRRQWRPPVYGPRAAPGGPRSGLTVTYTRREIVRPAPIYMPGSRPGPRDDWSNHRNGSAPGSRPPLVRGDDRPSNFRNSYGSSVPNTPPVIPPAYAPNPPPTTTTPAAVTTTPPPVNGQNPTNGRNRYGDRGDRNDRNDRGDRGNRTPPASAATQPAALAPAAPAPAINMPSAEPSQPRHMGRYSGPQTTPSAPAPAAVAPSPPPPQQHMGRYSSPQPAPSSPPPARATTPPPAQPQAQPSQPQQNQSQPDERKRGGSDNNDRDRRRVQN